MMKAAESDQRLTVYGTGAAPKPTPPAAQAAMHVPWTAEHAAGALVAHAHQPIGVVPLAANPDAAMHETKPALQAV